MLGSLLDDVEDDNIDHADVDVASNSSDRYSDGLLLNTLLQEVDASTYMLGRECRVRIVAGKTR